MAVSSQSYMEKFRVKKSEYKAQLIALVSAYADRCTAKQLKELVKRYA